jgi:hypothetical protein
MVAKFSCVSPLFLSLPWIQNTIPSPIWERFSRETPSIRFGSEFLLLGLWKLFCTWKTAFLLIEIKVSCSPSFYVPSSLLSEERVDSKDSE